MFLSVIYPANQCPVQSLTTVQENCLRITCKLPLGKFKVTYEQAERSLLDLLSVPKDANPAKYTSVRVELHPGALSKVEGFGIPFSSPDKDINSIVCGLTPIVDNLSLVEFLQSKSFLFVLGEPASKFEKAWHLINRSTDTFAYPYGEDHSWDVPKFKRMLATNKYKAQFRAMVS